MKRHWKLHVTGNVQGIFYRKSAKVKAEELHLSGWVRNEPDGSVYIEVEGDEIQLKQFIAWCKQGPPYARVQEVTMVEGVVRDFAKFEIRRHNHFPT